MEVKIIQGDAFKVLPTLPANFFDLVILDPPYLVIEDHPRVLEGVDLAIDGKDLDWETLFNEMYRLLKPNSSMLIFGHLSTLIEIVQILKRKRFKYVTDIVWVKPNVVNFLKSKEKPLSKHELITVWTKEKLRYNWQGGLEKGEPYKSRESDPSFYIVRKREIENPGFRYMSTVIFAPNKPLLDKEERTEHPTQKPLYLIRKLVSAFSFENDWVLDPFAGSGTTLVACYELNRNCIGIEIEPKYVDITKKRLEKSMKQKRLF